MQYITNAGMSCARYTITHFKHQHRVLQLIFNQMSVQHRHNSAIYVRTVRSKNLILLSYSHSSPSVYFFVHFKNVLLYLFMLSLCNIANVAQRTIEIVQNSRSRRHGNIIISTRMCIDHKSRHFHVRGTE